MIVRPTRADVSVRVIKRERSSYSDDIHILSFEYTIQSTGDTLHDIPFPKETTEEDLRGWVLGEKIS